MNHLDFSILAPAFVTGLLVLVTHVPLGQEVLKKGIIFIDLAIAQIAGLGVIAAHSFGWEAHGWEVQAAAVSAALGGALLLTWTEKRWPEIQEALIGSLFVLAASSGILLLANNPQGGEYLKELLIGQILWVEWRNLLPVTVVYSVILALWFSAGKNLGRFGFYTLFAVTVTASVQLVGVYLVFASLILPALGTLKLKKPLWAGYALGISGYVAGLLISALLDWPSGAVIVLMLAACGICLALVSRLFFQNTLLIK
ncbi:MAG: metal ABC transporter permease [Gammaproteobacteria bacterium]|nr:metal ABC transporter permease [Gammaproteobacteria bacterium]